jgi:2-haloacid dehalogenase
MAEAEISGIRACIFDAYGTLFDVHSAAARCRDDLGDKADRMSDIWRQKQLQYTWLRSLMRTHVDFWQITGDALDYAMAAVALDDPAMRQRLMDLYLELDAYAEVPAMLAALKAGGLQTGVLSNGAPTMLRAAIDSAGLTDLLDHGLSVEDVGIYKPDPRVYQLAADNVGVEPGAICFMSSNAWDAYAASHFGFRVVWVNRFGQPPERIPGAPDRELDNLAPLPGLLGIA